MKLNWAERWVVNNPIRVLEQGFHVRWFRKVKPLRPSDIVLEVGCGRGAGAVLTMRELGPARVHAMDLDHGMIRRGMRYVPPGLRSRISFYVGDLEALPHDRASMDAVFCYGVLHHVPDWRGAVAEICRILKPGGALYLEELYPTLYQNFITRHLLEHPTEDRFRSDDLRKALSDAGLRMLDSLEIKPIGILAVLAKSAP
jgi:ubiquinone/menaquinone biosynthesis C-methylase UbiE